MSNQTIVANPESQLSSYLKALEDKLNQAQNNENIACGNLEAAQMNLGNSEVQLNCVKSIWEMISTTNNNATKLQNLLDRSGQLAIKIATGGHWAYEAFKLLVICSEDVANEIACIKAKVEEVVQMLKDRSPKLDESAAIFTTIRDVQATVGEAHDAALATISKMLELYAAGALLTEQLGDKNCSEGVTKNVFDLEGIANQYSDVYYKKIESEWANAQQDLKDKIAALETEQEAKNLASAKLNAVKDAYNSAIAANAC